MIYICLPAHNEQQTVGVVLWKIRQVMADFPRDFQILVMDDASTDATADVLEPYTGVLPLTVLRNGERRGYAASLELLLREAVRRSSYPKRDSIVTLQADFTDEPEHIATLVKRIESGADIVCSSHSEDSTVGPREWRWSRTLGRLAMKRARLPKEAGDPLNGFRAYRVFTVRSALEAVGQERLLHRDGWTANAELLLATAPHARRVDAVELPFRHHRLQRDSRFPGWDALKDVVGFAFGRRGQAPVAQMGELHDALTTVRKRASLLTDEAALEEARTQRRDNAEQKGRNGRNGRRSGKASGRNGSASGGGSGSARKRSGPADEAPARGRPQAQESGNGAEGGRKRRRKRRSGRSRGGADGAPQAAAEQGGNTAGQDAGTGGGPAPEAVRAQAGSDESGEESVQKKRRRRRGRRGGRNRKRGGGGGGGGEGGGEQPQRVEG